MNKKVCVASCFVSVFIFVSLSIFCFAEQMDKRGTVKKSVKNGQSGKSCKGFNSKTDEIIEKDNDGNCTLYRRGKGSSGVGFIYDQDGELMMRTYGSDLTQ